jgi:hypothetical protein
MNNENECGSAKHCNLIPPLCGDTLISDSQFSISILKGRGLMDTARSIVHSVTHYIKNTDLYLMLLGLVCSIYGMLLIYSATLNPVTALDGSTKNLYVQGAAIILGLAALSRSV